MPKSSHIEASDSWEGGLTQLHQQIWPSYLWPRVHRAVEAVEE